MQVVHSFLTFCIMGGVSSESCVQDGQTYICTSLPHNYPSGLTSVIFLVSNVGDINSTVFTSESLHSVSSLVMVNAGITSLLPGALSSFRHLKRLMLSKNNITQIRTSWLSQPNLLENLTLSQNQIQVVETQTLADFTGLKSLNLSQNIIHKIAPQSFEKQKSLENLDLSGNRLSYISPENLHHLKVIRLDENPWDCSCKAQDFFLAIKDLLNTSRLEKETGVSCTTPELLKGQLVWNVSSCLPHNPLGSSQNVLPVFMAILAFIVILGCASCVLYMLCHQKQQIRPVMPVKDIPVEMSSPVSTTPPTVPRTLGNCGENITSRSIRVQLQRIYSAGSVLCSSDLFQKNSMSEKNTDHQIKQGSDIFTIFDREASEAEMQKTILSKNVGYSSSYMGSIMTEPQTHLCNINSIEEDNSLKNQASDNKNLVLLNIDRLINSDVVTKKKEIYKGLNGNKAHKTVLRWTSTWPPSSPQRRQYVQVKKNLNLEPTGNSQHKSGVKKINTFTQISIHHEMYPSPSQKDESELLSGACRDYKCMIERTGPKEECVSHSLPSNDPVTINLVDQIWACTSQLELRKASPQSIDLVQIFQAMDPLCSSLQEKSEKQKRTRSDYSINLNETGPFPQSGPVMLSQHARNYPTYNRLLDNNVDAYINLLQEVVQNQGRWTRDRWKKTHLNRKNTKQKTQAP